MEDEIKLSLQKEKDLNEMKSNFVAIASHEFRTPLSTILSSVSLIEKYTTTETQDKRARHVDRIRTAVTEMTAILEEFLSLEKIEQGKIHFKKESLNIIDIIRGTTITFGSLLKAGQEIEHFHSGKEEV